MHRYLDLGASLEVCHGPVDVLAADAVREILACRPQRPIILAESGAVEPRHSGPFKLYAEDQAGTLLHDILFAPFFTGAAGAGQIWHWDSYVDRNHLWHHFARFATAVKDLDPPAERFQPAQLEHPRLRVYALKGERTLLLWCRDKQNTWQAELRDHQPPETLTGLTLDLTELLSDRSFSSLRAYDPWHDRWSAVTMNGKIAPLPSFSRSLVLRLAKRRTIPSRLKRAARTDRPGRWTFLTVVPPVVPRPATWVRQSEAAWGARTPDRPPETEASSSQRARNRQTLPSSRSPTRKR